MGPFEDGAPSPTTHSRRPGAGRAPPIETPPAEDVGAVPDAPEPPDQPEPAESGIPGVSVITMEQLDAMDIPEPPILLALGGVPIAREEFVVMFGSAGKRKSYLAMVGLLDVAADDLDVLYVGAEGSLAANRKRLQFIRQGMRVDGRDVPMHRVHLCRGAFSMETYRGEWCDLLERVQPKLVVVDPLIEYLGGADENSSVELREVLDVIALSRDVGAAVIVVHHSTKPDDSARGSSALRGWTDHELHILDGKETGTTLVKHTKCREREQEPQRIVCWEFGEDRIVARLQLASVANDAASDELVRKIAEEMHAVLATWGTPQWHWDIYGDETPRNVKAMRPLASSGNSEQRDAAVRLLREEHRIAGGEGKPFRIVQPTAITDFVRDAPSAPKKPGGRRRVR